MDRHCIAKTTNDDPCQAQPVRPSGYCWFHDPALAGERAQKRREGGANRSNSARARKRLAGTLKDLAGVKALLLEGMEQTKNGEMEPGVLTALSTAARAVVAVSGAGEIEQRLAALEAAVGTRKESA